MHPPNGAGPRPSVPPSPVHAHPFYQQSPQREFSLSCSLYHDKLNTDVYESATCCPVPHDDASWYASRRCAVASWIRSCTWTPWATAATTDGCTLMIGGRHFRFYHSLYVLLTLLIIDPLHYFLVFCGFLNVRGFRQITFPYTLLRTQAELISSEHVAYIGTLLYMRE